MAGERVLESLSNRLLDLDGHIQVTEDETYAFILSKKNSSTLKKTKSDLNRFKTWLSEESENRELEDILPNELDMYIARYFLSVRNAKTNKELEPSTLQGMMASIRRYLVEKHYPVDPATDRQFKHSRDMLKAKAVHLKQQGLGNKSKRADPFTPSDIKRLYEKGLLGGVSPRALVSTMWMNNTMHLGLRGRQEHVTMLWGDLEMKKTTEGRRYIEYTERATKTRQKLNDDPRMFKPKLFEQKGDPNCPVELYLKYKRKRPTQDPQSRFYLTINRYWEKSCNDCWYTTGPMGKDTLGSLGKALSVTAGFEGHHSNHSGRKTFISNLLDSGCPPTEVAQLSGHKNLHSLNSYHTLSLDRQQELSDIIHKPSKNATVTVTSAHVSEQSNEPCNNVERNYEISDDELISASQEIEKTLQNIQSYEQLPTIADTAKVQTVNLPISHSPGGTISLSQFKSNPQSLFSGCTFNNSVNIVLKQ